MSYNQDARLKKIEAKLTELNNESRIYFMIPAECSEDKKEHWYYEGSEISKDAVMDNDSSVIFIENIKE